MTHDVKPLSPQQEQLWTEYAKAALAGVLASQPWYSSYGNPPAAHCAAHTADEMMEHHMLRFPGGRPQ